MCMQDEKKLLLQLKGKQKKKIAVYEKVHVGIHYIYIYIYMPSQVLLIFVTCNISIYKQVSLEKYIIEEERNERKKEEVVELHL